MNVLRERRGARLVVVGAALAVLAGSVGLVPTTAAVAPSAAKPQAKPKPKPVIAEQKVSPYRYFSPDGDGSADAVGVPFRLRAKARVSVVIRPMSSDSHSSPYDGVATKEVVRRADVGTRKAGDRTWWWRGRGDDGRVVEDGSYEITVKARPLGKKRPAGSISLVVDSHTTFHLRDDQSPAITVSRRSLYPDTTAIKDQISISTNELPGGRWDPEGSTARLSITDAAGAVVRQQTYPGHLLWDGTSSSGARVPNGLYTVHADWSDNYGHRVSRSANVTVAAGSLVRQDWSKTFDDPSDLLVQNGYSCPPGYYECEPHAVARQSTRFGTGLSFGPTALASFETTLPFAPLDPVVDRIRLSVSGGPAAAGDTTANAYYYPAGAVSSAVPSGDGTTVSEWFRTDRIGQTGRFGWTVGSAAGGYDVDSFTVDLVHWAPPTG